MKRGRSLPFVFLGPPLIILMVLALVPTLFAINLSFQNRTLSQGISHYIWFENYGALLAIRVF